MGGGFAGQRAGGTARHRPPRADVAESGRARTRLGIDDDVWSPCQPRLTRADSLPWRNKQEKR